MTENGWGKAEREVMFRLDDIASRLKDIEYRLLRIEKEIEVQKVKSSLLGGAAGAFIVVAEFLRRALMDP